MNKLNFTERLQTLKNAPVSKERTSERAEILKMFHERLNSERGKYPPLPIKRLAVMLSPIKSTSDLRAFYGECNSANNFSIYFWWQFKQVKLKK